MSQVNLTAHNLLKRLSRGMQALLLSVVALGATALLWAATLIQTPTWKQFLDAIATGLLVSAAFGIAQALVTNKVATELLRASVVEEVSKSLAESNNAFYPSHDFPASKAPGRSFNELLNRDLRNSSTFWFRGLSGRYTAARLALNESMALQAHLILPDPRIPGTIEGRVDYAFRHRIYPSLSIDEIRQKIKRDLAVGFIGLFEARHGCALLELVLTPMPLLDRYELFRDAIWVTLYSDDRGGTTFPRTLRYPSSSVMYTMQQADCLQTRNHPSTRLIQFPRTLTHTDLPDLYREITGETLSEDERTSLSEEFKKFADAFARDVGIGGAG